MNNVRSHAGNWYHRKSMRIISRFSWRRQRHGDLCKPVLSFFFGFTNGRLNQPYRCHIHHRYVNNYFESRVWCHYCSDFSFSFCRVVIHYRIIYSLIIEKSICTALNSVQKHLLFNKFILEPLRWILRWHNHFMQYFLWQEKKNRLKCLSEPYYSKMPFNALKIGWLCMSDVQMNRQRI